MWLYIPGMPSTTSLSAPEQEVSTSGSGYCSAIEYAPFVTVNGKATRRQLSWHGWKKRPWIRRLYGTISAPSTAARGVESWISYLRDTHASRSASPGSVLEKLTRDISGPTCDGLLKRYHHHWSSSRTSQVTFASALEPYEPSYDEWVIGLKRDYSARRKLASAISAGGSLPWHTPKVARGAYSRDKGQKGAERATLIGQAEKRNWATPRAEDAESAGRRVGRGVSDTLTAQVATSSWPTPAARDGKGANAGHGNRKGRQHMDQLPNYVAHLWPTPTANDAISDTRTNRSPTPGGSVRPILSMLSRLLPHTRRTMSGGHGCSSSCRRLNPLFVEWLMNWPIGLTGSASLETAWSHWWQQSRSTLFGSACETAEAA